MDDKSDFVELRILIDAGDWELLFQSSAYQKLSRSGRIVMLRRALENKERELVRAYVGIITANTVRAKEFHDKKIKPLWEYQDFLDRCMMFYETGEDDPGEAPLELEKLLK